MKSFIRNGALTIAMFAAANMHHCDVVRAQTNSSARSIAGTVTGFKVDSLEIGVKPDQGEAAFWKVGPETEVVQIPPGERDFSKAKPAKVTDIDPGDRVLVSFVTGLTEARRIVWISATDIAARNEAVRLDWQEHGVSGIVASRNGNEVTLEKRTPAGVETTLVAVTAKTTIRRYAPDSVKFADALPSNAGEISTGDQLRCRGPKSADGKGIFAEEIVFGTFLTKMGTIVSVSPAANEFQIRGFSNQETLTVRLTPNSQLKTMPDMRTMFANMMKGGGGHADTPPAHEGNFDIASMLSQLAATKIEDLKVGGAVVVTSTRGKRPGEITAIMLIANMETLIQMARSQTGDQSMDPMQAVSQLHGGMLTGPGGLSLPAIIP